MTYSTCPVCGFDKLSRPLEQFDICPCCGTEFGYDDSALTHEQLRIQWIRSGADWWSETTEPPADWNPIVQLIEGKILPVKPASENDSIETTTTFVGWGFYPQPIMRVA